jgi:hypothetical protein
VTTALQDDDQAAPFFITEEIEADMRAAGYVFEPPAHVRTTSMADVIAILSDDQLAIWPGEIAERERERRRAINDPKANRHAYNGTRAKADPRKARPPSY